MIIIDNRNIVTIPYLLDRYSYQHVDNLIIDILDSYSDRYKYRIKDITLTYENLYTKRSFGQDLDPDKEYMKVGIEPTDQMYIRSTEFREENGKKYIKISLSPLYSTSDKGISISDEIYTVKGLANHLCTIKNNGYKPYVAYTDKSKNNCTYSMSLAAMDYIDSYINPLSYIECDKNFGKGYNFDCARIHVDSVKVSIEDRTVKFYITII